MKLSVVVPSDTVNAIVPLVVDEVPEIVIPEAMSDVVMVVSLVETLTPVMAVIETVTEAA